MVLRPTQKLCVRIKTSVRASLPLADNPFADWSACLFSADRTQYILLANTASLYSTVIYARGITDDNLFIKRALDAIRESLAADSQAFFYQQFIAPACGVVHFAKSASRSVTGSMNDLIVQAAHLLTDPDLSPFDVGPKLNKIPFSALQHVYPLRAFKALTPPQPASQ